MASLVTIPHVVTWTCVSVQRPSRPITGPCLNFNVHLAPFESRLGRGRTSKSGPSVLVEGDPVHDWKAVKELLEGEGNHSSWDVYAQQKTRHFTCNASMRWLRMGSAPSDNPIIRFAPPLPWTRKPSPIVAMEGRLVEIEPILQASDSCM